MENKKQTIGFWDKGKETLLDNISTEGFDIGIKAEGKKLKATNIELTQNSKNKSSWYDKWWIRYIVFPLIVSFTVGFSLYLLNWN